MSRDLPPCVRQDVVESLWPDERGRLPPGNAGLVFDRYLRGWRSQVPDFDTDSLGEFVQGFGHAANRSDGAELLASVHARLAQVVGSLEEQVATRSLDLTARSRLAIGLGADHPTENGLLFDRTVGVPYLPGASLRGLCRHFAVLTNVPREEMLHLFGSQTTRASDPTPKRLGMLRFFDAYPVAWPALDVDVLTPHHRSYYQSGGKHPPGDWESPVPVVFLTVAPGASFRVHLGADGAHGGDAEAALERAVSWLVDAADLLGVGAKTAVGYGRLNDGIGKK